MSQSILRLGMTSPTASRAFIMSSSTIKPGKSILRRPTALPLSPSAGALPFAASFSVHLSPLAASPHVRFPPSPSLIDGTITAHSANSYDRAPINVSPNPVELPKRHTRIYSPSMEAFKLNSPPKATIAARRARRRASKSILLNPAPQSPAIVGFEDPRSPKPRAEAGQSIRFAPFATVSSRQPRDLGKSLSSYPRSPYPSAPLSPQGVPWPSKDVDVIGQRARAQSNEERKIPSKQHRAAAPFTPIPSPLNQSFVVPTPSARRPAPLDLAPTQDSEELSNAFWQSMTLESADEDGVMVTALEYPSSASALDVPMSALSHLPARVSLMFGGKDGALWSPQLRPEGMLSPGRKTAFNGTQMKRSYIASPSPHDPFAAFPSFSVALQKGDSVGAVAYPPRAVLEGF